MISNHDEEAETEIVWAHLKILFLVGDSKGSKNERKTEEEIRRQHQIMDKNRVWRFLEGSGRQEKLGKYCCNVICGAPTPVKNKRN